MSKKKPRTQAPRGATGTIRGISEPAATRILEQLVAALASVKPKGRRLAATNLLRERWHFQEPLVDGFLLALQRLPGVETGEAGEIIFPKNVRVYARHRGWRYATGKLHLAAAVEMATLLREARDPNLKKLADRIRTATEPLLKEQE